jgi:hypothetical protein
MTCTVVYSNRIPILPRASRSYKHDRRRLVGRARSRASAWSTYSSQGAVADRRASLAVPARVEVVETAHMPNSNSPLEGFCRCFHSLAAHYMTNDGVCGFCFCQAMRTDTRGQRRAIGSDGALVTTTWRGARETRRAHRTNGAVQRECVSLSATLSISRRRELAD